MTSWDASIYDRFERERARPAHELIERLPPPSPHRVLDFGCGSGLSTVALRLAFPHAEIVGVDLSRDMLMAAAERLPDVIFEEGDAASYDTVDFDLVFANALFQWVPGHLAALERIAAKLPSNGALAVQMPDNEDEPSHAAMREVAALPQFQDRCGPIGREIIASYADYDRILGAHCDWVDVWRTVYYHRLASADELVKWVEGTGLRPFLEPLDEAGRREFRSVYRDRVAQAYPAQPAGHILFPFPRLFMIAARR